MTPALRRILTALPLATCLLTLLPDVQAADPTAVAPAESTRFREIPATAETLRMLRRGGHVLYLRHGLTDNTRADRTPEVDFDDCSTQRPLSEAGRKLAQNVGEAMRRARIPLADIHVSPLCRARDTAAAAFPGQAFTVDRNLMYVANLTQAQKAPIIEHTRQLLSAPAPAGANRLLVAHAPNLMELIGYFPREGTLVVFRPLGDAGFEYLASIPPALWADLLH